MTGTAERRTEYKPLRELKANPANPKGHDVETINDSVTRFGYIDSVVIDERTGYLISGHGRHKTLQAMHERGAEPPDGILVGPDGDWLVPVQVGWSSRTDTEARAALIALNRTTELGGWVDESLLEILDDLDNFDGVGFEVEDLDDLRLRLDTVGPVTFPSGEGNIHEDDHDEDDPPSQVTITIQADGEASRLWAAHRIQYDTAEEALLALLS